MNSIPRTARLRDAGCRIAFVPSLAWLLLLAWFGLDSVAWFVAIVAALAFALGLAAWKLRGRAVRWPVLLALPLLALALLYGRLQPRNDRAWAFDAAQTPWAEIAGDTVTIHNYRNFDWHAADSATVRWETKTVRLSQLTAVDFGLVYWGDPHICHTLLTFDFGPDGFVCASIEARREAGETYSPLAGVFRKYELLYVLGDERDVLRLRTNFRHNDVYLFRLTAAPADARRMFLDYLASANALRPQPAWYNSLTTNCTTVIRQHEQRVAPGAPWSWRLVANGHLDAYLYSRGYVNRDLPLAELKRRSAITLAAQPAPAPDYSTAIRAGRPRLPDKPESVRD